MALLSSKKPRMNPLKTLGKWLEDGWWTRGLLVFQCWFCYFIVDWSMAFASTALATKADLLGAAANIGAVAAIPQALLMLATNKYVEMRAAQPRIIEDRRKAEDK